MNILYLVDVCFVFRVLMKNKETQLVSSPLSGPLRLLTRFEKAGWSSLIEGIIYVILIETGSKPRPSAKGWGF